MALQNCWRCGSVLPQSLFSKGHIFYIRQYYILRDGTARLLKSHYSYQPTIRNSRCLATKVKVPKPKARSPDADKKSRPGGKLRKFLVIGIPLTLIFTLVILLVVFAFTMLQSVKEAAKTHYFDLDTPTGVYNSVFDKLSQDNKIIGVLGEPVKEVKKKKVTLTRKQVDNVMSIVMEFDIQGPKKLGSVTLEASKQVGDKFQLTSLTMKIDDNENLVLGYVL